MKNKANQLTLSVSVAALACLCTLPEAAWAATIGVDSLRAPDGSPSPALSVDNNGNVGIGTTSPATDLDVRGWLTLEAGGSPALFTGTGTAELDRFLELYNSIGRASASGLKAGGVLVSDAFNYASPGKNELIVKGKVGIGTASPATALHVRGSLTIEDGNNPEIYTGTGTNELNRYLFLLNSSEFDTASGLKAGGVLVSDAYSYASPAKTNLIVKGNVGIGTPNPQARLDVNGQVRATTLLLTSDRNAKTNFASVSSHDVLKKVANLPLTTWHYTNAPGVRHLGPMAQDFKAAFNLGEDDKHIATVDADGVALASIQALYEMVQEKDSEIATLQRQVSALKTELAGVKDSVTDRLAALEKAMSKSVIQQASFRPEAAR